MLNLKSAEYVSYFGETMNVYEILVGNSEKKGPLWGPSCGWEDVTKMNLKERKY
jgi:hypothetical protein